MSSPTEPWTISRHAPLRADAESIFVPTSQLANASVGDRVVIDSVDPHQRRTGVVAERVADDASPSWRITLDGDRAGSTHRFAFAYDGWTGRIGRVFALGAGRSYVEVTDADVVVRFGPWRIETPLSNVSGAEVTGPYAPWKVAGTHWSLADHGLTFGTSARVGVCLRFHQPVTGLDPFGRLRHPGLTVTVADPHGLAALIETSLETKRRPGGSEPVVG